MADLGLLLGTLLTSLTHARRIADEETTAIAEYYREHPLLQGMSLPRVRVPELRLDLPILIQSHSAGAEHIPAGNAAIQRAVTTELRDQIKAENIKVPAAFSQLFSRELGRELKLLTPRDGGRRFPREVAVRATDNAFATTLKNSDRGSINDISTKRILANLRKTASDSALKTAGTPPAIEASILTAEIKEQADHNNVARLSIVLREEGLEWSISENEDGSIRGTLTPE